MKKEKQLLGVGVVGLGVGEQHVIAYAAIPECRIKKVVDYDIARARTVASSIVGCNAGINVEEIMKDPEIDIVSIASFDADHFSQVETAIVSGKHVFVEKPLCRELIELERIAGLLRGASMIHLESNLVLRGAPLYRWLREQISNDTFGHIYSIDAEYLYGRIQKITNGWRSKDKSYSVMLGGGIHLIDLTLWLIGQKPITVNSFGNRIATRNSEFSSDDFVTSVCSFESGLICRFTANFGCMHKHQHVLRIYGTKATFLLDDAGARIIKTREVAAPIERIEISALPDSKGILIPEFVKDILANKAMSDNDIDRVLDPIAVAIACEKSLIDKKTVSIQYF